MHVQYVLHLRDIEQRYIICMHKSWNLMSKWFPFHFSSHCFITSSCIYRLLVGFLRLEIPQCCHDLTDLCCFPFWLFWLMDFITSSLELDCDIREVLIHSIYISSGIIFGGKIKNTRNYWILSCTCACFACFLDVWLVTFLVLVVATDDEKIAECCQQFGADVIMTSESCRNGEQMNSFFFGHFKLWYFWGHISYYLLLLIGTERCNEALQKLGKKYDIVVNIQGDEPLIEPEIIDGIVKALQVRYFPPNFLNQEKRSILDSLSLWSHWNLLCSLQAAPDAVFSTAVTSLKPEDAHDPNRVKCVVDNHGYAIYFSRGLIPFNKYVKN